MGNPQRVLNWTEADYVRTCDIRDAVYGALCAWFGKGIATAMCGKGAARALRDVGVGVDLGTMYIFAEPCGTLRLTCNGETYTISIKPDTPRAVEAA